MLARILDDGEFVTDAGYLFGGSRKAKIKGAMHPILIETGDELVLVDAGFGPEMPEVLGLSDRILVLQGGRVVAEVDAADATEEAVLAAAMPRHA